MRHPLYFLVLALFLWGCVGRDFSTTPVEKIRTNVTTKAEIFSNFGEPVEKDSTVATRRGLTTAIRWVMH